MPKFYKRKYTKHPKDKYSVEQTAGILTVPASGQNYLQVVPPSTVQGMRKVKHITVTLGTGIGGSGVGNTAWWALVYVPQGTTVNTLNTSGAGASLYEPNQFVMNCGVFDSDCGPNRLTSPISRNLNSGDSIYLVIAHANAAELGMRYCIRYAVTLN